MYCCIGLACFNIWRVEKRPTLLSNSNPFWSQALVPFLNVINDKSNRSMSLYITFFHKAATKRLLRTTTAKSKYSFADTRPQGSEDDYSTICFEFESFRAQEPPFEYGRHCWTLVSHPKLFWHSTFSHTRLLGTGLVIGRVGSAIRLWLTRSRYFRDQDISCPIPSRRWSGSS